MITKSARSTLATLVYFAPYGIAFLLGVGVVQIFWPDFPFITLALVTIGVISIIVHWSWTMYIADQTWYQQHTPEDSQS